MKDQTSGTVRGPQLLGVLQNRIRFGDIYTPDHAY